MSTFLAIACPSPPGQISPSAVRENIASLQRGMMPAEVEALLGAPTVRESVTKDGKPVDYWSYLVAHKMRDRFATYACLTFTEGKLTEWVEDYGVGGHSNHAQR